MAKLEDWRSFKIPLAVFLSVYLFVIALASFHSLDTGCLNQFGSGCPQTPAGKVLEIGVPIGLALGWVPAALASGLQVLWHRFQ